MRAVLVELSMICQIENPIQQMTARKQQAIPAPLISSPLVNLDIVSPLHK